MSKHFTFSLAGLVLVAFFVYVFIASPPLTRINRGCSPIVWGGKAVTSLALIVSDRAGAATWRGVGNTFQACRYTVFNTFYRTQYERMKAAEQHSATASHVNDQTTDTQQ